MTPEVQWEWNWSGMAAVLGVVFSLTLLASVIWTTTEGWRRYALASIKALAVTLLLACLLNPTKQVIEPKPGENLLLVAVDQSRSLDLNDEQKSSPRRQAIQSALSGDQAWLNQLEDDYNVQYFGLGEQLKVVDREKAGQGTDTQSPLFTQTLQLAERFKDRSVAGIVVVTDGLATDSEASDTLNSTSPDIPVFPVIFGDHHSPLDLSFGRSSREPHQFRNNSTSGDGKNKPRRTRRPNGGGCLAGSERYRTRPTADHASGKNDGRSHLGSPEFCGTFESLSGDRKVRG